MTKIKNWFHKITTNKNIGQLIFRGIMMVVVPYIYLIICGFIDSALLKRGFAYREAYILFIFFSFMLFWLIAFILIGISIYKYVRKDTIQVQTIQPEPKREKKAPAKQNQKTSSKKDDITVEEIV